MSRLEAGDPLGRSARRRPAAPAADGPDGRWSYRRLDREASRVAGRVRERLDGSEGSGPRPRVAAFLPRRPVGLAAVHGVPRAGAVLAPLHGGWTRPELVSYLERVRPALLLGPEAALDRAEAAVPEAPRLPLSTGGTVGGEPEAGAPGAAGRREREGARGERPPETADGEPAAPDGDHSLVSTSGSTGEPVPVRLTWRNHLASAVGARERLGLGPDDRWYASLSLAHVGGLALAVRSAVVGSAVVLRGEFDAAELGRLAGEGRVTHASLVPVMLRRLLEAREGRALPESFRCALVGGAGAPPSLVERAGEADVPVALTYGLTEACSQVATAPPGLVRRKPGTAGAPLPGVEVRAGAEGEILVRGPTVSPGYLGGAALAADGWLRTGDTGRLDGDGHLWVTGRLSERIVTGGTTVHPSEVEAAIREHPGVRQAAVVGVESREWGEVVGAGVVREEAGPDHAELDRHCRERLSAPKLPRRWLFLDSMPRLESGKPDRVAVRRRLERS